jgi:hypothetical protein
MGLFNPTPDQAARRQAAWHILLVIGIPILSALLQRYGLPPIDQKSLQSSAPIVAPQPTPAQPQNTSTAIECSLRSRKNDDGNQQPPPFAPIAKIKKRLDQRRAHKRAKQHPAQQVMPGIEEPAKLPPVLPKQASQEATRWFESVAL